MTDEDLRTEVPPAIRQLGLVWFDGNADDTIVGMVSRVLGCAQKRFAPEWMLDGRFVARAIARAGPDRVHPACSS